MPLISTDIIFNIILITTLLNIQIHKSSGHIAFKSWGGRPFRECFSRCGHSRPSMSHRPRLLIKNAHLSLGNDNDDKYRTDSNYSVFYVLGTALNPLQELPTVGTVLTLILQMKNLRHKVKSLTKAIASH